jgi:hypothetical protein
MAFESHRVTKPLKHQAQGARPHGASMLGNSWVVKPQTCQSRFGESLKENSWGLSVGCRPIR